MEGGQEAVAELTEVADLQDLGLRALAAMIAEDASAETIEQIRAWLLHEDGVPEDMVDTAHEIGYAELRRRCNGAAAEASPPAA